MPLGTFSMCLNVYDLKISLDFYAKLGFRIIDGKVEDNWVMMDNGDVKLGLFQNQIPSNVLSFNPTDVRSLQSSLKAKGITFSLEADETTAGPAHAMLVDPDGNAILLDQF